MDIPRTPTTDVAISDALAEKFDEPRGQSRRSGASKRELRHVPLIGQFSVI
jgi:hypothetical protein